MADNETKTCPRDCMKCHEGQRLYCAAQMSRMNLERTDALMERFELLEDKVKRLDHGEEGVFNPMGEEAQETAV